ncbi:MAG: hypothetical protein Fur0022_07000 [Anaerolineales bacterium]
MHMFDLPLVVMPAFQGKLSTVSTLVKVVILAMAMGMHITYVQVGQQERQLMWLISAEVLTYI